MIRIKIMIFIFKLIPPFLRKRIPAPLPKDRMSFAKEHSNIKANIENLLICADYCGKCPSNDFQGGGFFCVAGKSTVEVTEKGCECFECPLIDQCGPNVGYFCIHGISPKDPDSLDPHKDPYLERFISHEPSIIESKIHDEAAYERDAIEINLDFITHDGDHSVKTDSFKTILESSLEADIPHIHACGGNGKCSTCRVLITEGIENLIPRNEVEQKMADLKGFTNEVRLACQTSGNGDIKLRRVVLDDSDIEEAVNQGRTSIGEVGREVEVAILFSDIRAFTSFSENSLPYDLVHILNRYFNTVGAKIDSNGGFIDKYMGDGIMAIFGLEKGKEDDASYLAVKAALEMVESLKEFNEYLKDHFDHTFSIGIGIHFGKVVIGNLGFYKKVEFTAIGDTVNTASRIESVNKRSGTSVLISKDVYEQVKDRLVLGKRFEVSVKGKEEPLRVFEPLSLK